MSTKFSDILQAKAKEREEKDAKKRELMALRAKMALEQEEKLRKAREEEQNRKNREIELKLLQQEELEKKERERKTKDYFILNGFNRKTLVPRDPWYFGEFSGHGGAWCPQGPGQYHLDGDLKIEGNFDKGLLQGRGVFHFANGVYDGEFQKGKLHGNCVIIDGDSRRIGLARNNVVVCFQDEIKIGSQIEIIDQYFPSSTFQYRSQPCVGVIQAILQGWKCRIRFHDDITPKEREVDLSILQHVRILKELPLIYNLDQIGVATDWKKPYDYSQDCFQGDVKYEIAGGRKRLDLHWVDVNPKSWDQRGRSNRSENYFEPRAAGIGAAREEEEKERIEELKRKHWEDLLRQKREEEEREKQKRIEEEQQKFLEESMKKQKQKNLKAKEEEEEYEKAKAAALAEENKKWDKS